MHVRYRLLVVMLGMLLVPSIHAVSGKIRTIHELPEYTSTILATTGTISVPYFQESSTSGSLDLFMTEWVSLDTLRTLTSGKHFWKPVSSHFIGTYSGVLPYSLLVLPENHSVFFLSGSLGKTFVLDGKIGPWFDDFTTPIQGAKGELAFMVRQGDVRTVYKNMKPYFTLPAMHVDPNGCWCTEDLYFDKKNQLRTYITTWGTGGSLEQHYREAKKIGERYQAIANLTERKNGAFLVYTGKRMDGNMEVVVERTGKPELIFGNYTSISLQFTYPDNVDQYQSDTRFSVVGLTASGIYELSQYQWWKFIGTYEFISYPSVEYGNNASLVFGQMKDGTYGLWINGKRDARIFDRIYNASMASDIPVVQYMLLDGKQYASVGNTIYGPYDNILNFYYNPKDTGTFLQAYTTQKWWMLYTFWKWYGPNDEMSEVNIEKYSPEWDSRTFQPTVASWQTFVRKNNKSYSLQNGKLIPLP